MPIFLEKNNEIATIIISNNNKKNALTSNMFSQLNDIVLKLNNDNNIKLVFFKGSGDHFSSGVYLDELIKFPSTEDAREYAILLETTMSNIFNMKKPTIALVDGYALGAGLAIILACDIRVFTKRAKLGIPAVKINAIFPANSIRRLIADIGLARAKDLLLTGKIISSEEGYQLGIVNYITEYNKLEEKGLKLQKQILKGATLALELTKKTANDIVETTKITYSSDNFAFLYSTAQWHKRIWGFLNPKE